MTHRIYVDGIAVPYEPGMTIIEACHGQGIYIPHLCWNEAYPPHGSCRVCNVRVNGREVAACTTLAEPDMQIENDTGDLVSMRQTLLKMLFVEGNHICPGCEKSGSCQLQAVAYYHGVCAPTLTHFYPIRPLDASHPDLLIDFNRCILCELCVRSSAETDGKNVFSMSGRGIDAHLVINSSSGKLADSSIESGDRAANICPVGAILHKHQGYSRPIGERFYDVNPVNVAGDVSDREHD